MKLIFTNGENLFQKEQAKDPISLIENISKTKLCLYQKQIIEQLLNNKSDYSIYGDDFKMELLINNVNDDCVIRLTDYDENQKQESEISIGFNDSELNQLINLLMEIKEKRNKKCR
jgi:hypothetical protein